LKKWLGLSIVSELIEGRGRVYRIEAQPADGVPLSTDPVSMMSQ